MGPIRGQTRPLPVTAEIAPETQRIDTKLNASIHNRFDIEVINAETGKVRQRAQAENVICNNLWTYMFHTGGYDNDWNCYIQYGSGSGTPSTTDTALFAYSGYGTPNTANDVYNYDGVNAVYSLKRKIVLSETEAVGVTITEMGIAKSTSDSLCTHAMLKDMNGNQISIAKTATDIINIYSTVFCHFGGDYRKYFAFGASSALLTYAVGMHCIGSGLFSNPYFYGVSGSSNAIFTPTNTHTAATKTLKCTFKRCGAGDGNYSGLLALVDNDTNAPGIMYVDNAWFAGSSVVSESIGTGDGVKKDFKTIFGFVKPGAKVYVDGVVSSAVVDVGTPTVVSDLSIYCRKVDKQGNLILGRPGYFSSDSKPSIFYNPNYAYGFTQIACGSGYSAKIEASDDLVNWTTAISNLGSTSVSIPSNLKNNKYWRVTKLSGSYDVTLTITSSELSGNNIHFGEAPASGAIITSDYDTTMIAKDVNHVFDISVTVQLGEHTS